MATNPRTIHPHQLVNVLTLLLLHHFFPKKIQFCLASEEVHVFCYILHMQHLKALINLLFSIERLSGISCCFLSVFHNFSMKRCLVFVVNHVLLSKCQLISTYVFFNYSFGRLLSDIPNRSQSVSKR